METIKGHKLPLTLDKIADLLYFDGPFVSLFEDKKEKLYYIYWWCDVCQKCNRWLIFTINHRQIKDYIDGNLSMREIVLETESFFLCDINNDVEYENVYFITHSHLPASYVPGKKSFFDIELSGISEDDLSILQERFMSENIKQKKNNVVPFKPIKKQGNYEKPSGVENFNNKEISNVA